MAPNKPIADSAESTATVTPEALRLNSSTPTNNLKADILINNNSNSSSNNVMNSNNSNHSKNVSNAKSSSPTSTSTSAAAAAVAALSRESPTTNNNTGTGVGSKRLNSAGSRTATNRTKSPMNAGDAGGGNIERPFISADHRMAPEVREYLFKILVIGELGTGKTSFIKRYVHQYFSQYYRATIGVDFALKVLNWDDTTLVRLQLWDIAGQERFGNMTRIYYKEAVGAFLVFDVSSPSSFNAVLKWKHDLDTKVCMADGEPIPCLLLANKCDANKEGIAADTELLDKFSKENNFCGWFYTSAKENINIEESAKFLVGKILQRQKHLAMEDEPDENDVINLAYGSHRVSKSNKCHC